MPPYTIHLAPSTTKIDLYEHTQEWILRLVPINWHLMDDTTGIKLLNTDPLCLRLFNPFERSLSLPNLRSDRCMLASRRTLVLDWSRWSVVAVSTISLGQVPIFHFDLPSNYFLSAMETTGEYRGYSFHLY